jgi:hypothetical protein
MSGAFWSIDLRNCAIPLGAGVDDEAAFVALFMRLAWA